MIHVPLLLLAASYTLALGQSVSKGSTTASTEQYTEIGRPNATSDSGSRQAQLRQLEFENQLLREEIQNRSARLRPTSTAETPSVTAEDPELVRLRTENAKLKSNLKSLQGPVPRDASLKRDGPSFEYSGFSFFTVAGASRAIDEGTKTVGNYGAGVQYSVNPRIAFAVEGLYAPLTGAFLDYVGISRQDVPLLRVTGYGISFGVQYTLLPRSRIQPYLSTGPGLTVARAYYQRSLGTWYAGAYGVGVGTKIYLIRNLGIYAGFGVQKGIIKSSGLATSLSLGAFYNLGKPKM